MNKCRNLEKISCVVKIRKNIQILKEFKYNQIKIMKHDSHRLVSVNFGDN